MPTTISCFISCVYHMDQFTAWANLMRSDMLHPNNDMVASPPFTLWVNFAEHCTTIHCVGKFCCMLTCLNLHILIRLSPTPVCCVCYTSSIHCVCNKLGNCTEPPESPLCNFYTAWHFFMITVIMWSIKMKLLNYSNKKYMSTICLGC